ncbi:murein transglycosylase domain-containing protein [Thalassotalea marina]|uniref:Membrane-bound lytic murein transglycosylase C n=1 Tax=Thalassotalea marina TaxID=1673741 RepID=A0A919EK87_9GAMM|nr:murein transglycosylase domain-containing protein [Thalassotalea marina]GHF88618.1 membrane-bound lytic murein transglycosylase C [Thalassotalea marina]
MSCQSTPHVEQLVKQVKNNPKRIDKVIIQAERTHKAINADIKQIQQAYAALEQLVESVWGKKHVQLPSSKKYVKYSNDYKARAIVDFATGKVTVETIAKKQAVHFLKKAIVTTVLTPADPRANDIFSSQAPQLGAQPFLFNQVLDQDQRAIRYQWRANRFANHIVAKNLVKRSNIHQVTFDLVDNHQHLRQQLYSDYVLAAAKRYRVKPDLIYAIIETESSFNPYAVSRANAYGLMQVVPATAGRDVYQKVKNKSGQPTKQLLFTPSANIDIGTAYLHLLQTRYLKAIQNHTSKEYSVISAYNGGAGNVLKTFDNNRARAMKDINQLKPKSVFWALTNKHPKAESRRYLKKVTQFKKNYQ